MKRAEICGNWLESLESRARMGMRAEPSQKHDEQLKNTSSARKLDEAPSSLWKRVNAHGSALDFEETHEYSQRRVKTLKIAWKLTVSSKSAWGLTGVRKRAEGSRTS